MNSDFCGSMYNTLKPKACVYIARLILSEFFGENFVHAGCVWKTRKNKIVSNFIFDFKSHFNKNSFLHYLKLPMQNSWPI
jgi:hypothetical protein